MSTKQPPVMTLRAWFHTRPYLIQWERLLRWRERVNGSMTTTHDSIDFLLVLFANIFQMRDWIQTSRPDLRADIAALFRDSENLGLARDLTNGAKHMTLTSYSVEGAASVAREYAGAGPVRHVVPRAGGRNIDALPLADACIAEIRAFMEKRRLFQ